MTATRVAAMLVALALAVGPCGVARADGEMIEAVASSFGPGLYGRGTAWRAHCATNEWQRESAWAILGPLSHGVAHRTLPLGSWIVAQLPIPDGGYSEPMPLVVLDRGPYRRGWHFDVTEPVVQSLGYRGSIHWGVAGRGRRPPILYREAPELGRFCPRADAWDAAG